MEIKTCFGISKKAVQIASATKLTNRQSDMLFLFISIPRKGYIFHNSYNLTK